MSNNTLKTFNFTLPTGNKPSFMLNQLIATSKIPVQFKKSKRCNVKNGQWYDVYTGQTFTKASDLDIDHVVPLAHAHRHGAANWTRAQRRAFANDFDNLLVVDDSTNQSKSDQAPHE